MGFDLIYNPAETRFMKYVRSAGGQAYNGLKMLLYQGIIAYELWNECMISEELAEEVYDRLYEAIHPASDNLVLIGFMGSGKTTVGHILKEHGYSLIDTDDYIEQSEGMTIKEIFDTYGEAYFREVETRTLKELIETTHHAVISTGGGMPLRRENARLLRELGTVWYLRVGEETIWNRVKKDTSRPLLQCEDPKGRIHELMQEREPIYKKAARAELRCDDRSPEAIAERILQVQSGRSEQHD